VACSPMPPRLQPSTPALRAVMSACQVQVGHLGAEMCLDALLQRIQTHAIAIPCFAGTHHGVIDKYVGHGCSVLVTWRTA
jgi:hypothetical protein